MKKLPVEVDIPEELVKMAQNEHSSLKERRVVELTLVAFYYLLRVGEYTSTHRNSKGGKKKKQTNKYKKKKTVNFRVCDVSFFKKDRFGRLRRLQDDAPAKDITPADGLKFGTSQSQRRSGYRRSKGKKESNTLWRRILAKHSSLRPRNWTIRASEACPLKGSIRTLCAQEALTH